jgi:hypothetical protein
VRLCLEIDCVLFFSERPLALVHHRGIGICAAGFRGVCVCVCVCVCVEKQENRLRRNRKQRMERQHAAKPASSAALLGVEAAEERPGVCVCVCVCVWLSV